MQCRYTEIAQRIFQYSDIQYISVTLDKKLNSLIYRTLFYVNIYGSYKRSKNSPFFLAHPVQWEQFSTEAEDGKVLLDMTASHNTVWHSGPVYKLSKIMLQCCCPMSCQLLWATRSFMPMTYALLWLSANSSVVRLQTWNKTSQYCERWSLMLSIANSFNAHNKMKTTKPQPLHVVSEIICSDFLRTATCESYLRCTSTLPTNSPARPLLALSPVKPRPATLPWRSVSTLWVGVFRPRTTMVSISITTTFTVTRWRSRPWPTAQTPVWDNQHRNRHTDTAHWRWQCNKTAFDKQ